MLLKVDHFEGFSNWNNTDELLINSTSGCNCKNYKLNNSSVFSYSANLDHKYPLHVVICLQNLVYFQLSLREICAIVLNMY